MVQRLTFFSLFLLISLTGFSQRKGFQLPLQQQTTQANRLLDATPLDPTR